VISMPIVTLGARLDLTGADWVRREIAVSAAGPIAAGLIRLRPSVEAVVSVHEAGHVVMQFLLGGRIHGASIIPWEGHSLGRTSARNPTPDELKQSWPTDEERIEDFSTLADGREEIEHFTEHLLIRHWPLVRALADALEQQKVIAGRRCRQILHRALRKRVRRIHARMERDRRARTG
jgi:hypothetical protein